MDFVMAALDSVHSQLKQGDLEIADLKSQVSMLEEATRSLTSVISDVRDSVPQNPEMQLNLLDRRLERLKDSQRQFQGEVQTHDEEVRREIERLKDKNEDLRIEMHNTILEIEAKAKAMPTTYADEDRQPKIVNGEVDISPLIRGIFRDSRRLDGFNELIATTRLECEDIVNAMLELQANMHKFNHNTHDLALEDGRIKTFCLERVGFLQSSIMGIDKQIRDIWSSMVQLAECCSHTASNASSAFAQLQTILNTLTTRQLPLMVDLSDLALECNALRETLFERRTQFEGERERFHHLPLDDSTVSRPIPDVRVKPLERRTVDTQNAIVLPYEDLQEKVKQKQVTMHGDSMIQRSVGELRANFREIQGQIEFLNHQFGELAQETGHKLEKKVDDVTMERLFDKIHRMINDHARRIATLEAGATAEEIAAQEAKRKTPKDPNAPSLRVIRKGAPAAISSLAPTDPWGSRTHPLSRPSRQTPEASSRLASSVASKFS
jgi:uncharacterized protein YoxC